MVSVSLVVVSVLVEVVCLWFLCLRVCMVVCYVIGFEVCSSYISMCLYVYEVVMISMAYVSRLVALTKSPVRQTCLFMAFIVTLTSLVVMLVP